MVDVVTMDDLSLQVASLSGTVADLVSQVTGFFVFADTTKTGVLRFATAEEVAAGVATGVAIDPAALADQLSGISSGISDPSQFSDGTIPLSKLVVGTEGKFLGYGPGGAVQPLDVVHDPAQFSDGSVGLSKIATGTEGKFLGYGPGGTVQPLDVVHDPAQFSDGSIGLSKIATGVAGKYLGYGAGGALEALDVPGGGGVLLSRVHSVLNAPVTVSTAGAVIMHQFTYTPVSSSSTIYVRYGARMTVSNGGAGNNFRFDGHLAFDGAAAGQTGLLLGGKIGAAPDGEGDWSSPIYLPASYNNADGSSVVIQFYGAPTYTGTVCSLQTGARFTVDEVAL